jgi:hypothetical protein
MTALGVAWAKGRTARPARPPRTPLLLLFAAWCGRRLPAWSKVRTTVMQVTAFGFLDYAAFQHSTITGCVAVGVSLLILEALSGDRPRR